MTAPFLSVHGLTAAYDISPKWIVRLATGGRRQFLRAVDNVDLEIERGQTFGLVGESGCGKTSVARLLVGLEKPLAGSILFDGRELGADAPRGARRAVRARMQMIFQDPYASLNSRWRVGRIVAEPIEFFKLTRSRMQTRQRVQLLLEQVGLSGSDADKYPHEFSGGQRQRVSIARALAGNPEFLACDEPTSALDVSVQAQVLNLMRDLQRDLGLTYLFISHNLAVVYHMADSVGVMYLGRIVESGPTKSVFGEPQHPYTRMLLDALPSLSLSGAPKQPIGGEIPSHLDPPSGCVFHPRCPFANERCRTESPRPLQRKDRTVACHAVEEQRLIALSLPRDPPPRPEAVETAPPGTGAVATSR
jgi:peptide/nickel transport system ATP-binding protein